MFFPTSRQFILFYDLQTQYSVFKETRQISSVFPTPRDTSSPRHIKKKRKSKYFIQKNDERINWHVRKFYVFSSFTGRRNNSVCLFLVVSCPDYRGKLSYNWSLCKREKTSKEEPFTGCKHGFRRFDFRSCFLAFVCLLRYRAHVSAVEMGYIIQNVAYRLGCR